MKTQKNKMLYIKSFLLPLACAIFLPLFHYSNNTSILLLQSLWRMLVASSLLSLILYVLFVIWVRGGGASANAAFVFLVFFCTYGIAYEYFMDLDLFQVEHYTLLPFYILLAIYASWFISKLNSQNSSRVWGNLTMIIGVLVIYNILKIIPAEINKARVTDGNVGASELITAEQSLSSADSPDIYFIILDEFAGFEAMREYWKYDEIDEFVEFLRSKGFFVAEQSHSSSTVTLHQLSERLNYNEIPCCGSEYYEIHYQAISENQVMRYLKSKGYSTVVFDETSWAYPAKTPVIADLTFRYDQVSSLDSGQFWDEFGILVANNTMMRAFSAYYSTMEVAKNQHRNFIYFTIDKVAEINEVPSPKFVYIHLLLPHMPFMFDENGVAVSAVHDTDWNYYLGQYKYSTKVATAIVNNILDSADPNRPPVIILQSDHGARNGGKIRHIKLTGYPEDYKSLIMNTLYLPGYDTSVLQQNVKPINTFPIVFNYLFGDDIPLK
jgi:Sulfatase